MRNRSLLSGLAIASAAALGGTGWAFTITPSFNSNSANLTPPVVWDANSMTVVNTAISDWTSLLSYTDPNQNINMNFLLLPAGGNPFTTFLGLWTSQGSTAPPPGTNLFPYSPTVSHTVEINSDLMNPRNGGVNYPDYLTLAFNQAAPNPNPDPNSTQWDALTVVRKTIGQALGFTLNYTDSSGTITAGTKWTDHVTITGGNAVFDQTPGGLNIPLAATTGAGEVQFADSTDLMGQGVLPLGTRIGISFQDLEVLSLAYGYAITVPSGRMFSSPTFKTQAITINGTVAVTAGTAAAGTPGAALTSQSLTMGAGGLLDISNHDLIVRGGSTLAQVQALIASGRGGTTGITSSTAGAAGLTLAVGTAGAINAAMFDGDAVSPTDILVKATYLGDANLDGHVNANDLSTVLNHFGQNTANWTSGNFDGAATIDLTDLADVLNNFGKTVTTGSVVGGGAVTATPEPASLAMLAGGAWMLLRRKRRA
jgi:hypothetical protein